MNGTDPRELLQALFEATLHELHTRMKGTPTATELGITRRALRDHGEHLHAVNDTDRRRLKLIRRLYLRRLEEALHGEPSAAVLQEVFRFLTEVGAVDPLKGHLEARKALAQLTAADLPFQ
jgi:hypothetical protein